MLVYQRVRASFLSKPQVMVDEPGDFNAPRPRSVGSIIYVYVKHVEVPVKMNTEWLPTRIEWVLPEIPWQLNIHHL